MTGAESERGPSLWLDPPPEAGPPLEGTARADVAVIGAGYAGLSTALALRERGVSVAVLERDFAGFGASGRNAGHLTPTIGKDLPSVLRGLGRERGGALVRLADEAVDHVEGVISDLRIDCDYRPAGNIVAGVHPGQQARLERSAGAGIELGAALRMLSAAELAERCVPAAFTCGYLEEKGGVLDPGAYIRGLAGAARDAGADLHERSPVLEVDSGPGGSVLRTPRGEVHADRIVVATNAYTRTLGVPAGGPVALRVALAATDPLPLEVRQRIGWSGEEGIYTAHEILESHRLTADGRILSGSRYIQYGNGGMPLAGEDPGVYGKIEAMMRMRFPEAEGVPIGRFWSGPIALNLNFLPWFGSSDDGRVIWGVGFAGHGIALASRAGEWLARMATGQDSGVPELTEARRIPMPPEPVRGAVAQGLIGGLEWVDRRTDRKI